MKHTALQDDKRHDWMTAQQRTQRRVLVIAYYFPPLGLSGVQRTLKFVKYLPSFGWLPTVLTVEEGAYYAKDADMLNELKGLPVDIVRTPSLDPLQIFKRKKKLKLPSRSTHSVLGSLSSAVLIPDSKIGWKTHALKAARKVLSDNKHDVIFASAPPYTSFLIASQLGKEFDIPVIFDYRDAWVANPLHRYPTPLHRTLHKRLERRALRNAAHVVTINRPIKELILQADPELAHTDITIVPQGFDQEDFNNLPPPPQLPPSPRRDRMRITYSGTMYYDRTPEYMLKALKTFVDKQPENRHGIELSIVGTGRDEDFRLIEETGLQDIVRVTGYLPHHRCVEQLIASDILWLMIGRSPGAFMMSTGKLYEYLGARKTILATIPDSAATEVLRQSGAAFICEPDDVTGIAEQISVLFDLYKNDRLPVPSCPFVAQFERRTLTEQLVGIFGSVLRPDPHESSVCTRTVTDIKRQHED